MRPCVLTVNMAGFRAWRIVCHAFNVKKHPNPQTEAVEEALKESEASFRRVFNSLPIPTFLWKIAKQTFVLLEYNAAADRLTFGTAGRFLGMSVEQIYPDRPDIRERFSTCSNQREVISYETPYHARGTGLDRVVILTYVAVSHDLLMLHIEDITDRKQAEETIRLQKAHMELTQQMARIGYWRFDVATGISVWSDMMFTVMGRDPAQGNPHYADLRENIHPDDWDTFDRAVQGAIAGTAYKIELRIIFPDHSIHVVMAQGCPQFDDDGTITTLFGITQDITERKQIEEHLRQANERFALAARAANLGVWDWDIQRNELIWDEYMYKLYGYPPQDFNGAYDAWLHGVHPDDRAASDDVSQQARRGEREYNTEFRIVRPDGVVRWLKAEGQVFWDEAGNPVRMLGINYDITDRKLTEDHLRRSERELKLTLDATTDGIWTWEFSTDALTFSPRYYTMLGYEPDEFPATFETWKALIYPDDRGQALAAAAEWLQTKPSTYENEFRLKTKDGKYRWIHARGKVVEWDDAGQALRMIGNHDDITARKQAEAKLKASLAEKEILLRELYHRTKNTLQVILSMLQLQAIKMPDCGAVQKLVKDTESRIMAMSLVHQKLYQSQDLSRIPMQAYLEDLARLIMQGYGAAAQHVSLAVDSEPVSLLIDTAIPCGLVVTELLTNALKYAFPDNRPGTLSIRVFRNAAGNLELWFADDGVGVSPGFDFRNQATLGLRTLLAIAEHQMQGSVTFASDQGVTCTIEFPDTLYTERV